MGILVEWDDQAQTVIRWDFDGRWDWTDLYHCEMQANEMCLSVNQTVDFILNMENTLWMPNGAFANFKAFSQRRPTNSGIVALAGSGLFIEMLVKTFSKFNLGMADQFVFVDTMAEARELLLA